MKATIIIPTFDHCELIQFPIESILRQTHQDFELFIIGDGAPEKTEQIVAKYEKQDSRVKYFKHSKGPRLGEAYRHPILQQATGDFVCYLADDDLYLENHLEVIAKELTNVDFTHSLPVKILPEGSIYVWQIDLSQKWYQDLLLRGTNRIPLGMGAHRMDLYQKLPFGWRTTPVGIPTDLYMWQQILNYQNVCVSSLFEPTVLHFASLDRRESSPAERFKELESYFQLIQIPSELAKLKTNISQAQQEIGYQFEIEITEYSRNLEQKLSEYIQVSKREENHLLEVITELKLHLAKQDLEIRERETSLEHYVIVNKQEENRLLDVIAELKSHLVKQDLEIIESESNWQQKLNDYITASNQEENHLLGVISELKNHLEKQDLEIKEIESSWKQKLNDYITASKREENHLLGVITELKNHLATQDLELARLRTIHKAEQKND